MWGAAPRPGRGRAPSRPRERSVQARRAKPSTATENGEQNARQAGDRRNSCTTRKPNFQASKLPSFHSPLHPRHVCDVPKGADAPTTRVRRFRRFRRCRSAPAGRWKGAVQSGESRRPICPIRPICPTAASKTASVGETQMFRRFARKTFGSSQILADLGELTQAGRMQGGAALSPLPYYIADVEAICLLGKGGGRVCGGAFKGAF